MAGRASAASDHLRAVCHRCPLYISFHGMASMERNQIKRSMKPVQTRRLCLFQPDLLFAGILDHGASCDDVLFREHAVEQSHPDSGRRIFHVNLQCLCFLF